MLPPRLLDGVKEGRDFVLETDVLRLPKGVPTSCGRLLEVELPRPPDVPSNNPYLCLSLLGVGGTLLISC